MAAKDVSITLLVRYRWWFKPAVKALCIVCRLLGRMPSEGLIRWITRTGVVLKVDR